MNIDRENIDSSGKRWRGKVVNVMDPKQQGRIQVRVYGLHDNEALIPDSELPWAMVRMPMGAGASVRGVSASPVGVIPGSIVDGYFIDNQRTQLVATGTLLGAGRTKNGQTIDGSYAIDSKYNDMAHGARGQDLNAALGLKNLPAISQIGAVFPAVSAGIGYLPSHSGNMLSLMSQADPYNMSGSLAYGIDGFAKNYMFNQLSSIASSLPNGATGLVSGLMQAQSLIGQGINEVEAYAALPSQIQTLIQMGGITQVLSLANSLVGNPLSLISGTVGGLVNAATNLASDIGAGFSSAINDLVGNLASTQKKRDLALKSAEPTPPPVPPAPETTSSKAAAKPATGATDPWAMTETYELPSVVINNTILEQNDALPETTVPYELQGGKVTNLDYEAENTNIMKQIGANSDKTQADQAADVRSALESRPSAKQRAADARAARGG